MSRNAKRWILVGLEAFTVIMAIYGNVSMLADATKFGLKEEWLRGSPFTNYQVPASGLLFGVGGSSFLAAATLLWGRIRPGALLSIVAGAILVVFEIVETYSIGLRNFQQPLMFVIGLLMGGLGALLCERDQSPASRSADRRRSA